MAILAVLALGGCGAAGTSPSEAATEPAASGTATAGTGGPSPSGQPTRDEGWANDLRQLIEARERIHPDPWHGIDREVYVAEVESVVGRIGELTDDELLVETVRLAAMPTWAGRDGHGGIHPWGEGEYGVHMYPLRLYVFSDGIFVVDALPPYRDVVGDEVVSIGGHDAADVLEAVAPLVPRDNEQQVVSHGPRLMVASEILHGLGLIQDATAPLPFVFTGTGSLDVVPIPMVAYERWAGGHHSLSPPARPQGAAWVRRISEPSWFEFDPDSGTLSIQYNLVTGGLGAARDEIAAREAEGTLRRIVVDVRHNPGGDNTTYRGFLSRLQDADAAGIPIYVIMGRATFSAAGNFVTEVAETTGAILVGEDLGTSPNQYGDSVVTRLEHSKLAFRVAPQHIIKADPNDPRTTIEPDLPAPIASDDYFGDTDPAMEAILADS